MSKESGTIKEEPTQFTCDRDAIEAKGRRERPTRITRDMLVNKGPLRVPSGVIESGMVPYWMKDTPYAFDKYYERGYDYAYDRDGNIIRVGNREGEGMILLKIPQELYDQTQSEKIALKAEMTAERKEIDPEKTREKVGAEGIFEEELRFTKR